MATNKSSDIIIKMHYFKLHYKLMEVVFNFIVSLSVNSRQSLRICAQTFQSTSTSSSLIPTWR